jgi:2-dehydropantoate 2-reductase
MDHQRILVIGAGVNGAVIAAGLHNAQIDVTVLARSKRYDDLLVQGIIIENPFNNNRSITRVPVINRLDPNDLYDYVLVVIRKNQVADILPVLAQNKSPNLVFMGNNLSGPDDFIKILGRERVMMGSVYAAGKQDGSLIRAIVVRSVKAPFGEVDGEITPRLRALAGILNQAGFKVELSGNIVDFQATHATGVALIGTLIRKHGCLTSALAHSRDDLRLYVDAKREAHQVLLALGRKILPRSEVFLAGMPTFLQIAGLRALLGSKFGQIGAGWHCSQAPDEIQQLAWELIQSVEKSGLPAPAIRKLLGTNHQVCTK